MRIKTSLATEAEGPQRAAGNSEHRKLLAILKQRSSSVIGRNNSWSLTMPLYELKNEL